jgi:tetratricopeptide (TPR) repeat protein
VPERLNKRRAVALLEQAQLHGQRGEWARVVDLAGQVVTSGPALASAVGLLADGQRKLGRRDEARATLEAGLRQFPREAELEARLGSLLLELEDVDQAVELLGRARSKTRRDPSLLTHYAAALLRAGRLEDAESQLAQALLLGGGLDSKLVLSLVKVRRGRFEEADALAGEVEVRAAQGHELQWAARAVRANLLLLLGDARGALDRWRAIDAAGMSEPGQLAHMAYAAQLVGEVEASDALRARRLAQGAGAEDLLLFAQIDNVRQQPSLALERLAQAEAARGERAPGWAFELAAAKGRALRLLGRIDEASELLEQATRDDAAATRLGAPVWVDLGHLAAAGGDFERAVECYGRALALVKDDPEAARGLELARRRVAWREAMQASAEERVDAAKAEAEAMRRRFVSREGELESLKRELDELKRTAAAAVREAEAGRAQVADEQKRRLREELEARERDAAEKAAENVALAFGGAVVVEPVGAMLLVAERTFQKALYTELPAAAVAVLFSGALERSLLELLVKPFDQWLGVGGRRAAFLEGAVRERRGARVEYFDRLIESFDHALDARAPALGEVSRVLERRREGYLAPFATFLAEGWALDEAYFDELGRFVQWSKEKLRDPVAHGRLELGWDELKRFREQLLFSFAGAPRGVLPALVLARRG